MRYGFVLPGGSVDEQIELAVLADERGWDGVFVAETAYGVDAWTLLGAMAVRTSHVRLGTMLTPLAWRRPWKVASQAVTLDQLSGGRAIVAVGLGANDDVLGQAGEVLDRRERASMLDEGIDVMTAMWSDDPQYAGRHYSVDFRSWRDIVGRAAPVGRDRVPIWVVGAWPRPKSMRRVLRCDGLLPVVMADEGQGFRPTTPDDIRAMTAWLDANGGRRPGFEIIAGAEETPADDPAKAAEIVAPWRDAGCTWWLESRWNDGGNDAVRARLEGGPPPA